MILQTFPLGKTLITWGMRAYLFDGSRAMHAIPAISPLQRNVNHHVFAKNPKILIQNYRRDIASHTSPSDSPKQAINTSNGNTLQQHWQTFLRTLHDQGHFSADPHIPPPSYLAQDKPQDKGAVKRAILSFARHRPDIFHTTLASRQSLVDLIKLGIPDTSDRKTSNAYKRLHATVVKRESLPPGDGGAADFQDVCRMVLSHMIQKEIAQNNARSRESSLNDILVYIIDAMKIDSAIDSTMLSDKAKNMQRLNSKKGNILEQTTTRSNS